MECQHATELIISAADGELIDAALLTEARLHCVTCPHCRSVQRLLERESVLSAPAAPASLVTRLEGLGAEIARENREAALPVPIDLPTEVPLPEPHRLPRRRLVGLIALASTAAIVFVALGLGTLVLNFRAVRQMAAEDSTFDLRTDEPLASPPADAGVGESAIMAEQQAAPEYVVFDGTVYVRSADPLPSLLTTAGTVVTDLGMGVSGDHTAMSSPGTTDPVFVKTAGGTYLSFTRVVRTFARTPYALSSETPITTFGQWPTLPDEYAVPESADGSPTFRERGFDDHGQSVYAPTTRLLDDAFAIAPDTPDDDPAAGNPNWTWWVKVE